MSRLGQVSLTKPTYRRIVLRCCSVPQAKPSPDYEYRISLRPHLWAIPLRAHGILQAGRARPRYESGATGIGKPENGSRPKAISEIARLRKVFARAGSRKPRSDKHQECSTTDNQEGSVGSRDSKGRCRSAA